MDRHIFCGEIVVIPVIGVKILHFLAVERYFENALFPFDLQVAVICPGVDASGKREVHFKADQKLLSLFPLMICVVVGLGAGD